MIRLTLTIPGTALRAGLRALLEADPAFQVIYAGPQPGELARADVWLVTDSFSPEEIRREIVTTQADVALLVLGDNAQAVQNYQNLPVRAWGVLPAEATIEALTAAIQALEAGLIVIYPDWITLPRARQVALVGEVEKLVEPLTERETEVLQWLAQGLSNKQIAARLHISEHTVKFHVSSVYGKLGATNRAEAVRVGAQQGLLVL
jgi:DNA-binding NarL/FixJ family response regulator